MVFLHFSPSPDSYKEKIFKLSGLYGSFGLPTFFPLENNAVFIKVKSLLYLHGLIWLTLAIFYFHTQYQPSGHSYQIIITTLLLINSLLYFALAHLFTPHRRPIYLLTLFLILTNLILTVTDQIGPADIIVLILSLLTLTLLLTKEKLEHL